MPVLPPLDCLRFFEIAARHESFARAAVELGVTPAAVAHRIRMLENHLGDTLFERQRSSVRLNSRGKAYLSDVRRILADIRNATERHRSRAGSRRLRVVSVECIAERWLLPRLVGFKASHPDISIELETSHRSADQRGFDLRFTCVVSSTAPREHPHTDATVEDTLFEESLTPVCSPALIQARGKPRRPADLLDWPLLCHLGWDADWPYWFARQSTREPDLSRASGFRLYSMVIQAAIEGLGAAVGRPTAIAGEIDRGDLVPLFDRNAGTGMRYCLLTAGDARHRDEVQAFRTWVLQEAAAGRRDASADRAPHETAG